MFNIMQRIWAEDGLQVPLSPLPSGKAYGCLSLGDEVGIIEVVSKPHAPSA